jgi:ElaB/YqjD/DUF883 family membrane-anchored ribosome-binding protein
MDERDDEAHEHEHAGHGGNGAARPSSARQLVEQGERVGQELASLAETARHAAEGWEDALRERLERQPYATLAVAAGIGYVLGGGVPTGLLRVLFALSGRALIDHYVSLLAPRKA